MGICKGFIVAFLFYAGFYNSYAHFRKIVCFRESFYNLRLFVMLSFLKLDWNLSEACNWRFLKQKLFVEAASALVAKHVVDFFLCLVYFRVKVG